MLGVTNLSFSIYSDLFLNLPKVSSSLPFLRIHGILSFYNGISASVMRQLTYSTSRFAFYETTKQLLPETAGFGYKVLAAASGGAIGGFIGVPFDVINVRMQNDVKLPADKQRRYKHAIDGFFRILKEEGVGSLYNGAPIATFRSAVMTVGQLSFYDQVKIVMIASGLFGDNPRTHFSASLIAAGIATTLTMPLDVVKTRLMNAEKGRYQSMMHCAREVAKEGPTAFYKGYLPAFFRVAPHTVLVFLTLEQMINYFGYVPEPKKTT